MPVLRRRQTYDVTEHPAKPAHIVVTHAGGDFIDTLARKFEHFPCAGDTKSALVFTRLHTGRPQKSTQKCPRLQTGVARNVRDTYGVLTLG